MSAPQCQLCKEPARYRSKLCKDHTKQLKLLLDPANHGSPADDIAASVPVLWRQLNPAPGGSNFNGDPRPQGFESSPAASLHAVAMRDDRSTKNPKVWFGGDGKGGTDWAKPFTEEENPPRPVRRTLVELTAKVDAVMTRFNPIGPWLPNGHWFSGDPVASLCQYLIFRFGELLTYDRVSEVLYDLEDLSDQLRRAIGDEPLKSPGKCISLIKQASGDGLKECKGPLRLMPPKPDDPKLDKNQAREAAQKVEVARCPRCHRRYTWLDLIKIKYLNSADAVAV